MGPPTHAAVACAAAALPTVPPSAAAPSADGPPRAALRALFGDGDGGGHRLDTGRPDDYDRADAGFTTPHDQLIKGA